MGEKGKGCQSRVFKWASVPSNIKNIYFLFKNLYSDDFSFCDRRNSSMFLNIQLGISSLSGYPNTDVVTVLEVFWRFTKASDKLRQGASSWCFKSI